MGQGAAAAAGHTYPAAPSEHPSQQPTGSGVLLSSPLTREKVGMQRDGFQRGQDGRGN